MIGERVAVDLEPLRVDAGVARFIAAACARSGVDASGLLRSLLLVEPIVERAEFAPLASRLSAERLRLLERLDLVVRETNPGASIVFRREFFAYRRSGQAGPVTGPASRTQTFLSVTPRRTGLHLALPLSPMRFADRPGVRDLRGVGHHGVGDVGFTILDAASLEMAIAIFGGWIGSGSASPESFDAVAAMPLPQR